MSNSRLFEVITLIYGETTAKSIVSGSVYERAVRCRSLITWPLKLILLEQLPGGVIDAAAKYFEECQTNQTFPSTIENSQQCQHLIGEAAKLREKLELTSDTNKMWFMYLD